MNNPIAPSNSRSRQAAFSMVEMIGVLAIIAILAVIIVPKVFSTIASARITSAVSSAAAMKSAVTDFAGKYGVLPVTTATRNARLDDLLVSEGLLDSRFTVKIGTQPGATLSAGSTWSRATGVWVPDTTGSDQSAQSRLICVTTSAGNVATTAAASATNGGNYRLNGPTSNLPVGSRVVSAVIPGLLAAQAQELSIRIDGDTATTTAADNNGKVVYAAPGTAGTTTAYIYITHQ